LECHMPRLLEAAARLGFRAVEAEGRLTVETLTGYTVASCPDGVVRLGLDGGEYRVAYGDGHLDTPDPETALALAYNAFAQSILEEHGPVIKRILDSLASYEPPRKCLAWAGEKLGGPSSVSCRLAISLGAYAAALNKWWGGLNPLEYDGIVYPAKDIPGMDEGLGLASAVCRWEGACERARELAERLLNVAPLPHARIGHLIAGSLYEYNTFTAAAAAHSFTLLAGPGSLHASPGRTAAPLLAGAEAAWLHQTRLHVHAGSFRERALLLLGYDDVMLQAPSRGGRGPHAVIGESWIPRPPALGYTARAREYAASAALMGHAGILYERKGVPVAYAHTSNGAGAWIARLPGDPKGPWDAVLEASRIDVEEVGVPGLLGIPVKR